MRTFDFDPDHARVLAGDLLGAALTAPPTPTSLTADVTDSPALASFTDALHRALAGVDAHTRAVHDRARQLAEDSASAVTAAVDTDRAFAADLGRRA